jgi:hypothetical protein
MDSAPREENTDAIDVAIRRRGHVDVGIGAERLDGKSGADAQLKKAANCAACHKEHKPA